jgi:alpha-beta hydrolase superfamily lysophospholipase
MMKNKTINIELGNVTLKGDLVLPENAIGIVVFSHGSGSSRLSPRNKYVAELIQHQKIATLLFDLLTEEEDKIYETRFDIDLLTSRLIEVTDWLTIQKRTMNLPLAYFGASTGAASALRAAAHFGNMIKAVVSRGGRPDLAFNVLQKVTAPTLLIVGGLDTTVIQINEQAYDELKATKELKIIHGATHLFEEPGKLLEAAEVAIAWFKKNLSKQ